MAPHRMLCYFVASCLGPGLVFVAYPEALSRMPIAPFWSVSFFVMFFTVALDSQVSTVKSLI